MNAGVSLGRYTLHAELASGGMATVYIGRLNGVVGFGRTVAIKRLHPHLAKDPEFVTMFLDEAKLAARIQHPNVVPTLDVVATDGELFLVMEYVKGETLSALVRATLKGNGTIPVPIVCAIIAGVLSGLDAAHEAKDERGTPLDIVHRDISPQNVIVGADGAARLLDFGVAKAASRLSTTREGHLKGKIPYMPPEQLAGIVSRQTDIYSLGVVFWEALACKRLFVGESEVAVMSLVQKGEIAKPSAYNPHVPPELDRIVLRALSRDPATRYESAHAMAKDIDGSVDIASSMRVAEWMKAVAGVTLEAKNKLVAEIESGVSSVGKPEVFDALRTPGVQDSQRVPAVPASAPSVANVTFGEPSMTPSPQSFATVSSVAKATPQTSRRWVLGVAGIFGAGLTIAAASLLGVFSRGHHDTVNAGSSAVTSAQVSAANSSSPILSSSSLAASSPSSSASTHPAVSASASAIHAGTGKHGGSAIDSTKKNTAASPSSNPNDIDNTLLDSR